MAFYTCRVESIYWNIPIYSQYLSFCCSNIPRVFEIYSCEKQVPISFLIHYLARYDYAQGAMSLEIKVSTYSAVPSLRVNFFPNIKKDTS